MPLNQLKIAFGFIVFSFFCFSLALHGQSQSKTVLDQPNTETNKSDADRLPPPARHQDVYESGQHYQSQPDHYGPASYAQAASYCDCTSCANGGKRTGLFSIGKCRSWFPRPTFAVEEVRYGANAGLPSFGVVSHGPWYNGETRELFPGRCNPLFRKRGLRHSRIGSDCGHCRQYGNDCDGGEYYGEGFYEGAGAVPQSNLAPTLSPSNSYPLESIVDESPANAEQKKN